MLELLTALTFSTQEITINPADRDIAYSICRHFVRYNEGSFTDELVSLYSKEGKAIGYENNISYGIEKAKRIYLLIQDSVNRGGCYKVYDNAKEIKRYVQEANYS